jgi:hypothetical protein
MHLLAKLLQELVAPRIAHTQLAEAAAVGPPMEGRSTAVTTQHNVLERSVWVTVKQIHGGIDTLNSMHAH